MNTKKYRSQNVHCMSIRKCDAITEAVMIKKKIKLIMGKQKEKAIEGSIWI